jgi:hypothetical protein
MEFRVLEKDGDITVTDGLFTAIYFKPDKLDPQLKLKRRTHTDDHALLAKAWIAAKEKARQLGWIVRLSGCLHSVQVAGMSNIKSHQSRGGGPRRRDSAYSPCTTLSCGRLKWTTRRSSLSSS